MLQAGWTAELGREEGWRAFVSRRVVRDERIVNECSDCGGKVRDGRVVRCRAIGSGSETDVPVE